MCNNKSVKDQKQSLKTFFCIRPSPGLLPVLGPLEWYMTPTLDTTLLISSKAYTPSTHTSSRDMYGLLTHHTPAEPYMDNVSEPSSNLYYSYRLHHQLPGNHDEVPLHLSNVAGCELA